MKIELIPYQNITLSGSSPIYPAVEGWSWPSEDAWEVEGYNYATLDIYFETYITETSEVTFIEFYVAESNDKLNFQKIETSVYQPSIPEEASGAFYEYGITRAMDFGKYIKPMFGVGASIAPTTFSIRVTITLQKI